MDLPSWLTGLHTESASSKPARDQAVLEEYPVRLGIQQQADSAALIREFQLITLDADHRTSGVGAPSELLEFARLMDEQYAAALAGPREELERAHAAGEPTTTLRYPLLPESRRIILYYAEVMEKADAFCRSGALMHLGTAPGLLALRRWVVEEFVHQYDGAAPRPWPGVPEVALGV